MSQSLQAFTIAGVPFEFDDENLDAFFELADELALDEQLGELLFEALDLIEQGLAALQNDKPGVIKSVIRHHYDIARRVVYRGYPIAVAIRLCVEDEDSFNDSKLVCAYGIAKAAKGLKKLADWIHAIEQELLDADSPELLDGYRASLLDAKEHDKETYYQIVDDLRRQWPKQEIDARESCVRLLGEARHSLMLSSVYSDLSQKRQEIESRWLIDHASREKSADGGRQIAGNFRWAYRFIEANLVQIAYDNHGSKLSRHKLANLLCEKILPEEKELQLKKANPKGEPTLPSFDQIYGGKGKDRTGWLIKLGFNELPDKSNS
ncbi:hypothetical protein GLV89_14575 [Halomonas alkaliantarctica]|nr:hypothetical protein [Halomonas alkaliantarctica]